MEPTHLDNPPIIEALVDLQVALPQNISLRDLEGYQDAIRDGYPQKQQLLNAESQFQLLPGTQLTTVDTQIRGYLFRSDSHSHVVQARLDGYTFSRLHPYNSWSAMRIEAVKLWKHYVSIAKPRSINRVALRYINRIVLPSAGGKLNEFFLTYPELAPLIPQRVSEFLMRMVLPTDSNRQAIVTIATDPGITNKVVITFDIDVFQTGAFGVDGDEVWQAIDALRELKNRIFFGTLTDAVLREYINDTTHHA